MNRKPPSDRLLLQLCGLLPATGSCPAPVPGLALLDVRGSDAIDFVQRIGAQDVVGLSPGTSAPIAFLTAKGKLVAIAIAIRAADGVTLVVPGARVDELAQSLERYHFSERLTITCKAPVAAALLGLGAAERAGVSIGSTRQEPDGSLVLAVARGGLERAIAFGPAAERAPFATPSPRDERLCACLRIAAGEPQVGVDTDERTLVLEAGLDDHVSTTKGCYVGQEIVARIHTYGHVNRRLVRLRIEGAIELAAGTLLLDAALGETIGRVTSSAVAPDDSFTVALGWLPGAVLDQPGAFDRGAVRIAGAANKVQVAGLAPAQTTSA
ncbi:MAG: hypothetical protein HZB39_07075 [Planctomycetes bacterium]|nr:hypothetical protein [Planctomycetota bacterium]